MNMWFGQPCLFPNCRNDAAVRGKGFCNDHIEYERLKDDLLRRREESPGLIDGLTAVYVIGSERVGAIKIGIAVDVMARVAALQTGFPHPLSVYSATYTSRRFAESTGTSRVRFLTRPEVSL